MKTLYVRTLNSLLKWVSSRETGGLKRSYTVFRALGMPSHLSLVWCRGERGHFNEGQVCHLRCCYCFKKSWMFGSQSHQVSRKWRKRTAVTGLPCRWPLSYCRELSSYSVPFLGADVSVVRRTQRYLHETLEQSPVSVPDLTPDKKHCVRSSPPRCLM